ncbi:dihydrofolate reductase [Aquimarina sp. MAR_2010_214]|uniref:dihydrofolate reductase n=1 Tax=Aquimarina sp. MAR_2010_214 TaxID=1250026 RepID=UPI000C711E19|nr:dihydrofolate reductase [Aquimarina sp. MAR_2010_214]PKV49565.1 dihydrofolate reductase [Aquimarina sp. MAR_2010_214]
MFLKKKETIQIDPQQRELYEHARKRVIQKKRLFQHFIIFLVGSVFFAILNLALGYGKEVVLFGIDWYIVSILCWAFLLVIHFCNVWLFSTFMGQEWADRQMERLIAKQKEEIVLLQKDIDLMYPKEELVKKKEGFIKGKASEIVEELKETKNMITMIAAAGENNALGKDNDLVWHLPDDFKRFKKLTTGHHIIMGRKTFETFPKLLPNRVHVVITRNTGYQAEGAIVVHNMQDALEIAKGDTQPFIIGGGEIYTMGMDHADCIELTRVHETFEADAFFPEIDTKIWKLDKEEFHDVDEKHKHPFTYYTYTRK